MNRLTCIISLFFILPLTMLAQTEPGAGPSSLGIVAEVSVPAAEFANIAGTGYGGLARYQYRVDQKTATTFSAGYLVWGEKEITNTTKVQAKAFEIMGGGKLYFARNFFCSLEGGLYGLSYTRTGNVTGYEGTTWRLMLPIGLGYQTNGVELGARYIYSMDFWNFSFTLGYNFAL